MILPTAGAAKRERSAAMIFWLAVSMSVIVVVVAIGQGGDVGGGLGAAADLYDHYGANQGTDPNGSAAAAARASALANGYSNDGTSSTVTVNVPPTSGLFAGRAEYVEVIVESKLSATFGAVLTNQPLTVRARAVARGRAKKHGILT